VLCYAVVHLFCCWVILSCLTFHKLVFEEQWPSALGLSEFFSIQVNWCFCKVIIYCDYYAQKQNILRTKYFSRMNMSTSLICRRIWEEGILDNTLVSYFFLIHTLFVISTNILSNEYIVQPNNKKYHSSMTLLKYTILPLFQNYHFSKNYSLICQTNPYYLMFLFLSPPAHVLFFFLHMTQPNTNLKFEKR
jgi:hypothetical protein